MDTKKIIVAGLVGLSVLLPLAALATDFNNTPPNANLDWGNVSTSIRTAIWEIFVLMAVIMFILAGISFLTASGDPDKVKLARTEFLWGVVGVVIAILAYSIINVLGGLLGAQ